MKAKIAPDGTELEIDGRPISLTHLSKVFYPKTGFTKGQIIDYYIKIAPYLLPHLKGHAMTLKRYPDGVNGPFFYEKRCPSYRPKWMKTTDTWSERLGENVRFCLFDDLSSLIWTINLANLELHAYLARGAKQDCPTAMVFDLDPGPPADVIQCAQVAIWLRDLLKKEKLKCFPKTSGSKGMQVYIPLNTAVTFEATKKKAREIAEQLTTEHPAEVLSLMTRKLRPGKVFIDWSQNDAHKTTVCVYSLRAKERPTVSTPLAWEEVERALRTGKAEALTFEADAVVKRAVKMGDLFEPVLKLKQKLPK
jgi:bifunctional non-homologous end joining protein LigD